MKTNEWIPIDEFDFEKAKDITATGPYGEKPLVVTLYQGKWPRYSILGYGKFFRVDVYNERYTAHPDEVTHVMLLDEPEPPTEEKRND